MQSARGQNNATRFLRAWAAQSPRSTFSLPLPFRLPFPLPFPNSPHSTLPPALLRQKEEREKSNHGGREICKKETQCKKSPHSYPALPAKDQTDPPHIHLHEKENDKKKITKVVISPPPLPSARRRLLTKGRAAARSFQRGTNIRIGRFRLVRGRGRKGRQKGSEDVAQTLTPTHTLSIFLSRWGR